MIQRNLALDYPAIGGPVVLKECIPVRAVGERDIEDPRILESLLHSAADRVGIIFGFDYGDWDVGLVVEDVVGLLRLATLYSLAMYYDPALGEVNLFTNLREGIPLLPIRADEGGCDELGPYIRFGEAFLVHSPNPVRM